MESKKPQPARPEFITIGRARRYLVEHHGICVTRQTVYNWMKPTKRRGVLLRSVSRAGRRLTTRKWVDDAVADS